MIYIFTENIFFERGIVSALYPLLVETVPLHEYHNSAYQRIVDDDILLIDASIGLHNIIYAATRHAHNLKVVFLNSYKSREINFRVLYASSRVINSRMPLDDFRASILEVVTTKYHTACYKNALNAKERYVLLASIGGESVHAIAAQSGLKEKTVYHNRKSACRKFGVDKVCELAPYLHTFSG